MRRKIVVITTLLFIISVLSGCCAVHGWQEATCTEPRTCDTCGKTQGEPLGHEWKEATCTDPKTCMRCGATEGEALGHILDRASCVHRQTCMVCGYETDNWADHVWMEATCIRPRRCEVCGLEDGSAKGHNFVYDIDDSRTCLTCGYSDLETMNDWEYLDKESHFERREFEFNIQNGSSWVYTTRANGSNEEVKGTATVIDYRKYYCDVEHTAKSGYEWREVTIKFEMPTGARVMWGYTDTYAGMELYPRDNYVLDYDGTRIPVETAEAYKYDWVEDETTGVETCVSYGNFAIQVPEDYEDLVFYVCDSDYEITHRTDPNIKFMSMN